MKPPSPNELSSELSSFARVVEQIADRHIAPAAAGIDASGEIPVSTLRVLADNELLTAGLPIDCGGGGGGDLGAAILVERLAAASASVAAVTIGSHVCGLIARYLAPSLAETPDAAIVAAGTGELQIADIDGRATLNGTARRVESVGTTSTLIVVADHADKPVALIVSATAPGVSWSQPTERTGLRGVTTRSITFEDVSVSVDDIVSAGAGVRLQLLLSAALCCGIGRAAINEATRYLDEREQFGQRLSEFAALRVMLSEMTITIAGAAALTFDAARGNGLDIAATAATAAAANAVAVTISAVQMHGGYGWTTAYPVERLMRDAATARARIGGTQTNLELIATKLLPTRSDSVWSPRWT